MFQADLHIHSTHSRHPIFGPSGAVEPWQALARARALRLQAVAITDHDTIAGSLAAMRIAPHWGVIVVPGVEVSTRQGHILALGVQEDIPRGRSAGRTIGIVHELGGICVAAHPCNGLISLRRRQLAGLEIDALETYNARSFFNFRARRAAYMLDLPHVGGSDAHFIQEIGNGVTFYPEDCQTWQDILDAIRLGLTLAGGTRARYIKHVARGHLRTAYRYQRDRIRHRMWDSVAV